jgi:Metal binding domain of Ada
LEKVYATKLELPVVRHRRRKRTYEPRRQPQPQTKSIRLSVTAEALRTDEPRNQPFPEADSMTWNLAGRLPYYAPHDSRLEGLEKEARGKGLGLWADKKRLPPWEWRETRGVTLPPELASKHVGNRRSRIYHAPGCKAVSRMAAGNRVAFDSEEAAQAAGYRPGKDCHKGL